MSALDDTDTPVLSFRERRLLASATASSTSCPYLSTVDRSKLDFDMSPVCSLSLSPHNVYACLCCGLFFNGRSSSTPAFVHAVEHSHHVWVSLTPPEGVTEGVGEGSWRPRFWCLPDGYEVLDASLEDIAATIRPRFSAAQLAALAASPAMALDASGTPFLPGYVGANNLGHTDGILALVQALAHVTPLRNYFLADPPPYSHARSALVHRFGELLRRIWAAKALRATISPHAFINAVSEASNRRFSPGTPIDVTELLPWLLNSLHKALVEVQAPLPAGAVEAAAAAAAAAAPVAGTKRPRAGTQAPTPSGASSTSTSTSSSIISHVFAGEVEITLLSSGLEEARRKEAAAASKAKGRRKRNVDDVGAGEDEDEEEEEEEEEEQAQAQSSAAAPQPASASFQPTVTRRPFLFLTLDLPPVPLFTDARGGIQIPQVSVHELLQRFDGVTVAETLQGQFWEKRRYRITRLPSVLALVFKRFTRNAFFAEKNATIVTCPTRSLELRPFVEPRALAHARAAAAAAMARTAAAAAAAVKPLPQLQDIPALPVAALRAVLGQLGALPSRAEASGMDRGELVRLAAAAVAAAAAGGAAGGQGSQAAAPPPPLPPAAAAAVSKYDLVASVVHEVAANTESGGPGMGGKAKAKGVGAVAGSGGGAASSSSSAAAAAAPAPAPGAATTTDSLLSSAAAAVKSRASGSDPLQRGAYKVHLLGPGAAGAASSGAQQQQWYEISDLRVEEILAQQVGVSESCLLFFSRRETAEGVAAALAEASAEQQGV